VARKKKEVKTPEERIEILEAQVNALGEIVEAQSSWNESMEELLGTIVGETMYFASEQGGRWEKFADTLEDLTKVGE